MPRVGAPGAAAPPRAIDVGPAPPQTARGAPPLSPHIDGKTVMTKGEAGMVSNASLTVREGTMGGLLLGGGRAAAFQSPSLPQEEEIEAVVAPEVLVLEEERLRAERSAAPAAPPSNPLEAVLTKSRAAELDKLLDQTDLYTQFLSEQMQSIEAKADDGGEGAGEGGKRKAKGKAPAGKKVKQAPQKVQDGRGDGVARVVVVVVGRPSRSADPPTPPFCRSSCRSSRASCETTNSKVGGWEGGRRGGGGWSAPPPARDPPRSSPTPFFSPLSPPPGIKWLISLYQNGLNGILADQMGLGKTVQTIGFLSHLRSKGVHGPFLIVGPLSTLPNWTAEVQRWAPSIPVVLYHGSRDERNAIRANAMGPSSRKPTEDFPIVVTSYEIVLADAKFLAAYKWKYIVVDEGHRLKNMNCRLLRELRTIPTANKLLLTGTPLQNNLSELWSLLNFLLPDIFGSLADFESWFDFSAVGQEGGDKEIAAQEQRNRVVTKLHSILK